MKNFIKISLLFIALVLLTGQAGVSFLRLYIFSAIDFSGSASDLIPKVAGNDFDRLLSAGNCMARAINYANRNVAPGKKIMVFRTGKFVTYAKVKILKWFHPSLNPVYTSKTAKQAWRQLLQLGVSHIYIPGYYNPMITDTVLNGVLTNPRYSQRRFYCAGHTIYKILGPKNSPTEDQESAEVVYRYPEPESGPKSVKRIWSTQVDGVSQSLAGAPQVSTPLWSDAQKVLYTGAGPLDLAPGNCSTPLRLRPKTHYKISGELVGQGRVSILAVSYWPTGLAKMNTLIWEGVLSSGSHSLKPFAGLYTTTEDEDCLRIILKLETAGSLRVKNLVIEDAGPAKGIRVIDQSESDGDQLSAWHPVPNGYRVWNRLKSQTFWGVYTQGFEASPSTGSAASSPDDLSKSCGKRIKVVIQGKGIVHLTATYGAKVGWPLAESSSNRYYFLHHGKRELTLELPEWASLSKTKLSVTAIGMRFLPIKIQDVTRTELHIETIAFQKGCRNSEAGKPLGAITWQTVRRFSPDVRLLPATAHKFQ